VVIDNFRFPELRNNYLNQVRLYDRRYSPGAIIGAERDSCGISGDSSSDRSLARASFSSVCYTVTADSSVAFGFPFCFIADKAHIMHGFPLRTDPQQS